MTKDHDQDWLLGYLEHVAYEITGLVTSYMRMTQIGKFGQNHPIGKQGEQNDCLDLMALHFRNLHEFFCDGINNDYVRASDYVPEFKGQRENSLINKANRQVSHLSKARHEFAQDPNIKGWDVNKVMKWLISALDAWEARLNEAQKKNLNEQLGEVKKFIDWYRTQIQQGRV